MVTNQIKEKESKVERWLIKTNKEQKVCAIVLTPLFIVLGFTLHNNNFYGVALLAFTAWLVIGRAGWEIKEGITSDVGFIN